DAHPGWPSEYEVAGCSMRSVGIDAVVRDPLADLDQSLLVGLGGDPWQRHDRAWMRPTGDPQQVDGVGGRVRRDDRADAPAEGRIVRPFLLERRVVDVPPHVEVLWREAIAPGLLAGLRDLVDGADGLEEA